MSLRNSREWKTLPIDEIKPYGRQLRRHDRRKIDKLKKLIAHFGQVVPVIVDHGRVILDGHAVWQAMRELGAGEVATITVSGRSDSEIRALRLALNRLPADAAWGPKALRAEFEELVSLSFDLELTGFEATEINHILAIDLPSVTPAEKESTIPPVEAIAVSQPGDIWRCGGHRVGCGHAHDPDFVARVAEGQAADVALIAPHYGPGAGLASGVGDENFTPIQAETAKESYAKALHALKRCCSSNAWIYTCIDWRGLRDLLGAADGAALELLNICV